MRLFRAVSILFLAAMVLSPLLGCKQQPADKIQSPVFDEKNADWARIDLLDTNSPIQGFIDQKTYRPVVNLTVDFWHKLATEKEAVVTHLLLDCQADKYKMLARLTYDDKGNLTSQVAAQTEWKKIAPDSNAESLCLTLAPTGTDLIMKEDLPIIRNLLLSGMKKVK